MAVRKQTCGPKALALGPRWLAFTNFYGARRFGSRRRLSQGHVKCAGLRAAFEARRVRAIRPGRYGAAGQPGSAELALDAVWR